MTTWKWVVMAEAVMEMMEVTLMVKRMAMLSVKQ